MRVEVPCAFYLTAADNSIPLNNHLPKDIVTLSKAPHCLENLCLLATENLI